MPDSGDLLGTADDRCPTPARGWAQEDQGPNARYGQIWNPVAGWTGGIIPWAELSLPPHPVWSSPARGGHTHRRADFIGGLQQFRSEAAGGFPRALAFADCPGRHARDQPYLYEISGFQNSPNQGLSGRFGRKFDARISANKE